MHQIEFIRLIHLTGGEIAKNILEADIVILHFCGLSTEELKNIVPILAITDKLKEQNPDVKVYAGGCAEGIINLKKRGKIDGVFRRGHMVEDLSKYFNYEYKKDISAIHYHGTVKIQMGCNRRCGFCKKAYMNMQNKSTPMEEVLASVKKAIADGYGDIGLLAENSTEYGWDLNPRIRLIDLLKEICSLDGLKFLTINGLCLDELAMDDELVNYISTNNKIRKVQLESQSLIPLVRKNMKLSSTREDVIRILKAFENKHIVSNIMVGYPGENDGDFDKQLKTIKEYGLYYIQPNMYVNTPGVYGSTLKQIPKKVASKRLCKLVENLIEVREKEAEKVVGSVIPCVYTLEGRFEMLGGTANVEINNCHKKFSYGQIVRVKIKSFKSFSMRENQVIYEGVKMRDESV